MGIHVKIAFISHWNDFCLIPLGKCASWRNATNSCKNSNFEFFESTLHNTLLYIYNFNYLDKPHFWYKKVLFYMPVYWFCVENTVNLLPNWDFFTVRQTTHQIKVSWSEPIGSLHYSQPIGSPNIKVIECANWLTLLKSANWLTKNKDKTRGNIFYHIIVVQNL